MDIGLPPASPSDKDIDLKVKLSSRIQIEIWSIVQEGSIINNSICN